MKTPDFSILRHRDLSTWFEVKANDEGNQKLSQEEISISVSQVKWLISRFLHTTWVKTNPKNNSFDDLWWELSSLIDTDIIEWVNNDNNPEMIENDEYNRIMLDIRWKLARPEINESYEDYRNNIKNNFVQLKKLAKYYEKGKITIVKNWKKEVVILSDIQKNTIARQIIRLLEFFKGELEEQIQNIHNQVASEKRDYNNTDIKSIEEYYKKLNNCTNEISRLLANNYEVAIQLRSDQIVEDSRILKRQNVVNSKNWKKAWLWYLETKSRMETIYWNKTADNYVLASLRWWQNVEFFGPTWTWKTKLAIHAAKAFSWKNPVVVPGWLWVNKTTFYWSAKDLWKRNPGALIKCLEEDRVLIIDEDNAIDPRQMKEIKYILWLKSGDVFIHPDTWDRLVVPPHFRVVVTRNEKWKHHTDRFDLPVEYRREFTHWSFEIDYYTESETYDRFLIPKLINSDWSIDLSVEEIWWDINKPWDTSPLLALVKAAKEIQTEFKNHKLTNSVFESGYMLDVLDQFKEVKFKVKENWKKISFLEYLEQKLIEFIKRPIWNKDRKIIVTKLYEQWFFRWYTNDVFQTPWEWFVFSDEEYKKLTELEKSKNWNILFKTPSWNYLQAREVALLDPFYQREIKEPKHPLEKQIEEFSSVYKPICRKFWIRAVSYSNSSFDSARPQIVEWIKKIIEETPVSNKSALKTMLETYLKLNLKEFIEKVLKLLETIFKNK